MEIVDGIHELIMERERERVLELSGRLGVYMQGWFHHICAWLEPRHLHFTWCRAAVTF